MDMPPVPPHPLDALTSYELSRYRRQLEHALKAVPGHDPPAPDSSSASPTSKPNNTPAPRSPPPAARPDPLATNRTKVFDSERPGLHARPSANRPSC